jgi:hypothetical protein
LLELEGADVASAQPAQAALVISMAIIAMAVLSLTRPSPTTFPGFTHPNNVLGRMITSSTHSNAAVGRCSATFITAGIDTPCCWQRNHFLVKICSSMVTGASYGLSIDYCVLG